MPLVAPAVRQAMQDCNFAEARKAIDEAAKAKDAPSDYLADPAGLVAGAGQARGPGHRRAGPLREGLSPEPWLRRARFARAQAMVAKHDFRGAQVIYEQEAKYLLSVERRQQSADRLPGVWRRPGPARPGRQTANYQAHGISIRRPRYGPGGPARAEVEFRVGFLLAETRRPRKRRRLFRSSSRHGDDPRLWKPVTGWANACWPPASCREARKAWRELLKTPGGQRRAPVARRNVGTTCQ